jgi:hypothetical protein
MKNNMKKIILYTILSLSIYSCNSDFNDYPQGTLKGIVLDATTEEGLADVDIRLNPVVAANGNVTTNDEGFFNLSRLTTGTYTINVIKDGVSLLNSVQDTITIVDGCVIEKTYKLTPRVSISDFSVDYDKKDPTKFTIHFKAQGNQGNQLTYYSIMWDKYPTYKFGDLAATQKIAIKYTASNSAEITKELTGLNLDKGSSYYIRVGVTHLKSGGDYNHSKVYKITFD